MHRNKTIGIDFFSSTILLTAIRKLIKVKAELALRNIKHFLPKKKLRPLVNTTMRQTTGGNTNTIFSTNFKKSKIEASFKRNAYTNTAMAMHVKGSNVAIDECDDYSGNAIGLSSAQIVYAVILKQQIEWMKDSEKKAK